VTETLRLNRIIEQGQMTELEFFALAITEWKTSEERKLQILGDKYYAGEHDILKRQRMVISESGELKPVANLPNNKIIDNQYAKMVDQKVNYLVGKPLTVDAENKDYGDLVRGAFNKKFLRVLKYLAEDCLNGGISWTFICYDDKGKLSFRRFPAHAILPFWQDDDRTILECAVRLYEMEDWTGRTKSTVERVEIFKPDGIYRYVLDGFNLVPDVQMGEHEPYLTVTETNGTAAYYNWEKIPLIPFRYNKKEIPLIQRTKSLQDGINTILSDFQNNMQEDARNTILIIKNYDDADLGEFRHNLQMYGAVKVRDDGGVETLMVEVNSDNYKVILETFKRALIENARGYDATDLRSRGAPNQMNIKSIFNDLDLDANGMETEYQAAFEDIIWFINQDLINKGNGDYTNEEIAIIFNRDGIVSESEVITDIRNSMGLLSEETLVGQHPYVTNVEDELQRIQEERAKAEEAMYAGAFAREPTPIGGGAGEE